MQKSLNNYNNTSHLFLIIFDLVQCLIYYFNKLLECVKKNRDLMQGSKYFSDFEVLGVIINYSNTIKSNIT